MSKDVTITIHDLPALREQYNTAVREGAEAFEFKGAQLLTAYAKYLVQHLENLSKEVRQ